MKKNIILTLAGLAAGLAMSVQANSISGTINFAATKYTTDITGSANNAPLGKRGAEAKVLKTVTGATVNSADGTFTPTVGDSATFHTPITFNPPAQTFPLWTVDDGADTFNFYSTEQDAATYHYASAAANANVTEIQLGGLGYVVEIQDLGSVNLGKSDGTWTLQLTGSGSALTFQSSATVVPDGGLTVALLGGSLMVLGALRRKLS